MNRRSRIYTGLVFFFLFAPILVLIFFSFNSAKSLSVFENFSIKWYKELLNDAVTLGALRNTLILAVLSSVISTVMGTFAAVGIFRLRNKYVKRAYQTVTDIPMINPDIITGISMMLMFVFAGKVFSLSNSLGFRTMLLAHITFCLPYVILQVLPKLQQMDESIPEAAMDLGCSPTKAFFKVEIPEILPGIVTGMIMAFTLSLDDFVISYFTQGAGFQTLPIRIYNMTKKTVTPKMYALATIIFFVILGMLLVTNMMDNVSDKKASARSKKVLLAVLAFIFIFLILNAISFGNTLTLNVYNWGEYISDGSEDTYDTIAEFESWYEETYGQKIKVNYDTFASCEDMYAKLKSESVSYDVCIPSDYMIARMKEENMLLPIDFENIPNYEYISDDYKGLYYDPDNEYTVPYAYGVVGVIYNANVVDEEDVGSWDIMWNEKYKNDIVQFANPRDAFGTAMYKLGISVNTTDKAEWDRAYAELAKQSPMVKSYVMDEIYNMMESGEAAIGAYYAGDYFTMVDAQSQNVDLQFYYPERTNYYVDAMCIPSCCQNKELAEIFINFMLSEEAAIANAEYTYYACPNSLVYENEDYLDELGEETIAILYQDYGDSSFAEEYNKFAYQNLPQEMLDYENTLWEKLKIS